MRIGLCESKGAAERRLFRNVSHQAPLGPRIFYENPLSSVAYGDTPFQRMGAFALRYAALVTQKANPVTPCFPLRENATKWQKGVRG